MRFLFSVVLLAGMVPCSLGQVSQGGFFQVSVMCATESRRGWARVFANRSEGWKVYDALATIPADSTADVAQVWRGPFGNTLVLVTEKEHGVSSATTYCFQPDGALLAIDHQLQTEWGWGHGTQKRTAQGKIETVYSHFVDLRSGREVKYPNRLKHRSEVKLDVPTYWKFAEMPFAPLFEPLKDSEKY